MQQVAREAVASQARTVMTGFENQLAEANKPPIAQADTWEFMRSPARVTYVEADEEEGGKNKTLKVKVM